MASRGLEAFYKKAVAPRLAQMVRDEIKALVSKQAPVALIGGRLVATVPATPGAPPRKVTGRGHAMVQARGNKVVMLAAHKGVFYMWVNDAKDHPFIKKAVRLALARSRSSNARVKG